MTDSIKIDTKEVDRLAKVLGTNRDGIVRRMAFQVEGVAKQLAPYETTALRNSNYTETANGAYQDGQPTSFSGVDSKVKEKRKMAQTSQHPKPDEGFANVGPSVNYALPVEMGTHKMAAQPYLTPAVEQVVQRYNNGTEWEELTK